MLFGRVFDTLWLVLGFDWAEKWTGTNEETNDEELGGSGGK